MDQPLVPTAHPSYTAGAPDRATPQQLDIDSSRDPGRPSIHTPSICTSTRAWIYILAWLNAPSLPDWIIGPCAAATKCGVSIGRSYAEEAWASRHPVLQRSGAVPYDRDHQDYSSCEGHGEAGGSPTPLSVAGSLTMTPPAMIHGLRSTRTFSEVVCP